MAGEVGVGPGQEVDAVTPEHRHVAFPQPQHGVDPEPGPAARVVGCGGGQSGGEAGVDEERVTYLDGDTGSVSARSVRRG